MTIHKSGLPGVIYKSASTTVKLQMRFLLVYLLLLKITANAIIKAMATIVTSIKA